MKKIYSLLLIVCSLVVGISFFGPGSAHADATVVSAAEVISGSTATVVIKGTLGTADRQALSNGGAYGMISLEYGILSPNETTATAKTTKSAKCSDPDSSNKFICTLSELPADTYLYQAGILVVEHDLAGSEGIIVPKKFTPFFTGYRQFTVTASSVGSTTVAFGSVGGISGNSIAKYTVPVTMKIGKVPAPVPMSLHLGTANQIGSTSNYLCKAGPWSSGDQTVGPATGEEPVSVTFIVPNLPDGNYCVSVQQNLGVGSFAPILSTTGSDIDANGFFNTRGAIIHVGNATPLAPGATNDANANATGCVTNSDNSNYCMLAPLPGLGDGTGNLDVTKGFGDYLLTIIKIVMGLIGVLSVFMIVVGGIEYMSTVSVGEKEGAKSRITSALFGLLLALSSYIILNTLNPRLVNLGVTIPSVQVSVSTFTQTAGDDGLDANAAGVKVKNAAGAEISACNTGSLVSLSTSELDQGMNIFSTSSSFQVNPAVKADLIAAFAKYKSAVAAKPSLASYKINSIYGYRCKAATGDKTVYSGHAFGLAVDINPSTNGFTKGAIITDLPDELVEALKAKGFGWGGNWNSSKDAMHFSKLQNEKGTGDDSYSYE